MSVTDAERAFYESVLADPVGKSIQDLRYAYFLAAVDGGLPSPSVSWDSIYDRPTSFPSTWVTVSGKPSSFPPATHSHAIADVTGLQAILDDLETRVSALEGVTP